MNPARQKAARRFAEAWAGRGYEKGDTQVFWTELLQQVVGMTGVSQNVKFEYRTSDGGFIDCFIPEAGVLIEQKGRDIDLDKPEERQGRMVTPFEQALAYAESFRPTNQPRFIVICNFQTFRVHDRESCERNKLAEQYLEFSLAELGEAPHLLGFIADAAQARAEKERQVSMKAGSLIGKLYDALLGQYLDPESAESQHSLNVLCVRLVFCLFCEDAPGLFPKDAFLNYLRRVEPEDMRMALRRLFRALDTPLAERDPYDEKVRPFPYVNGGLFAEDVEIPNFTPDIKHLLLFEVSQETDWSKISPTIFGGIFESTLNPETRHAGGMHYTSPENIHKVIDPLFLDGLYDELNKALAAPVAGGAQTKRLRELHRKIAGLDFLDPACGSGNFLTEAYLSLRKIEDDILNALNDGQAAFSFGGDAGEKGPRVRLSQFHGIEINDFAVRVAKTALWIAQLQANNETDMLLDMDPQDFPLKDSAGIVQANALRIDWNEVLSANQCDYIMGNPPFLGHQDMSSEQHEDIDRVLHECGKHGKLDYVAGWYAVAQLYTSASHAPVAFVSTNSICQGEQVSILWDYLFARGIRIIYAHRSFIWENEAEDQAHVHCVIVGFAGGEPKAKAIYSENGLVYPRQINGYLFDGPLASVSSRSKNVNPQLAGKKLIKGSQPTDGGNLLFKKEEGEAFLARYPECKSLVRKFIGADEFINGRYRYCLWLKDVSPIKYMNNDEIMGRLAAVREMRLSSPTKSVQKDADTPFLFTQIRQPETNYLLFPRHSSGRRRYLPLGFLPPDVIASDAASFIPDADLYMFGVLSSLMHNAWMRVVCGRLKSDYRYQPAVYNSFVFPDADEASKRMIENAAQGVLDARASYDGASLADLYDPDKAMVFPALVYAHRELDAAVEAAYGIDFGGDEEKIVAHLFRLYAEHAESR